MGAQLAAVFMHKHGHVGVQIAIDYLLPQNSVAVEKAGKQVAAFFSQAVIRQRPLFAQKAAAFLHRKQLLFTQKAGSSTFSAREMHRLGIPGWVAGMGTNAYGYWL